MKKMTKNTTEKYVTIPIFEKAMSNHAVIMANILTEIKTIHEENKYFRSSISNLNIEDFSHYKKIENLTVRVEKLEAKRR